MALEKFHHTFELTDEETGEPAGTYEIELKKFKNLPFGLIRKNRKLPQHEQFFALLEGILSEEELDHLDSVTQSQVSDFLEAWQKDSGVSQGESSDS